MQPTDTIGQGVRYPIVVGGAEPSVTSSIAPLLDGFHAFVTWLEALFHKP